MDVRIRHEISETSEEIYSFNISNKYIRYTSIMISNRDNKNDIWGYDWNEYYNKQENEEVEKLRVLAGLDECDSDDDLYDTKYADEYAIISVKYNPVYHKTIEGKTRLYGISSNRLWDDYPPKLTKRKLLKLIKKEAKNIIDNLEL